MMEMRFDASQHAHDFSSEEEGMLWTQIYTVVAQAPEESPRESRFER